MIEYHEIFWGDSTIERTVIEYDKILIAVFNDALQKKINIVCSNCIGISKMFTWDEVIIENVFIENIISSEHPMWIKTYELYGMESYDSEKNLMNPFYELKVVLINGFEFNVVCQEILFED